MYRNHLAKLARTRLDDILLDEGVIERSVAEDALAEQEVTGRLLSEILIERQAIDEWDLAKIVATHYGLPFIDVKAYDVPREARDLLPNEFCRERLVLPVDTFGHTASFAVVEMPHAHVLAEIERLSGKAPFVYVAVRRPIIDLLDEWDAIERKKAGKAPRPERVERTSPASTAATVSGDEGAAAVAADPDAQIETAASPPQIELISSEPDDPAPDPTAHVPPPNQGILGPLPAITLMLGATPSDVGIDVATAGAVGRVAARAPAPVSAATPAASEAPAGDSAPAEASGGWQSIFDEGDEATSAE